jgi:hypothetical protein
MVVVRPTGLEPVISCSGTKRSTFGRCGQLGRFTQLGLAALLACLWTRILSLHGSCCL